MNACFYRVVVIAVGGGVRAAVKLWCVFAFAAVFTSATAIVVISVMLCQLSFWLAPFFFDHVPHSEPLSIILSSFQKFSLSLKAGLRIVNVALGFYKFHQSNIAVLTGN